MNSPDPAEGATHPMTTNNPALTDAYHAIFDTKDKLPEGSSTRYLAYEALQKLAALMESLGWDVPRRFDGEGRTDGVEPPYLTLTEEDAVEVFAALSIAAQAAVPFDKVVSAHYSGLYSKLAGQARGSAR